MQFDTPLVVPLPRQRAAPIAWLQSSARAHVRRLAVLALAVAVAPDSDPGLTIPGG